MDPITGALIAGGGSLLGGLITNQGASDRQADANAFSAQQFATRYQTTVKDMQAAGLNPMLAYSQGGGNAPTSAQPAPVTNYLRDASQSAVEGYSTASRAALQREQTNQAEADTQVKRAQRYLVDAQTSLAGASADQARAATNNLEFQAKKISEEIKNIPVEGDRLRALIVNLAASSDLMRKQGLTQDQTVNQVKWLGVKAMLESDLLGLDIKAASSFDNLGREYAQIKPVIDLLRSFFPAARR